MRARSVQIRGIVQGVGFRPFVFRLARRLSLTGWVLNHEAGVEIHVEGAETDLTRFLEALTADPPPAAQIVSVDVQPAEPAGFRNFLIQPSQRAGAPSARISTDLPVCDECLRELADPPDPRFGYPYLNCTNCGPRYSIVEALPYDRCSTTMKSWPMDRLCERQYHDPEDRRFHAQPVACPACGPHYYLEHGTETVTGDSAAVARAAALLNTGAIVAVKGIGGYHLACDARNAAAVRVLRERKFRKEKPFALMAPDQQTACRLANFTPAALDLLLSPARPIVIAPALARLDGVAPDTADLGVMLPYTPLHHLLFAAGAPPVMVMTSANRSSEPIAYEDDDAHARLAGIADAFLIGERAIARRLDDSIVRARASGPCVLRRSRGYSPAVIAALPSDRPLLALGADLKNAIALSAGGEIVVSQYIGDLEHYSALQAFRETIDDLALMYEASRADWIVAHDAHPQYASARHAAEIAPPERRIAVQHHRAHIASVLAEREEWRRDVLGVAFDGTGYGDDGTIWGGEFFTGSICSGFQRVAHLRPAVLPGGDAAARFPVQAAAGFLAQLDSTPDLTAAPFHFPLPYRAVQLLVRSRFRNFATTSAGRLFDAVAALTGFIRPTTYEGQAAMWLEQVARASNDAAAYPFPFDGGELDFRPALQAIIEDRMRGREPADVARAFHRGLACGLAGVIRTIRCDGVALSGGVFQNELLLEDLHDELIGSGIPVLTNHAVPPNDGGICLGQIALAAFHHA